MDKDIAFFKKTLPEPNQMEITLVKAKVEIIKDSKHEDGRLEVNVSKSSTGMTDYYWCGMLVKDLYRGYDWCGDVYKEKHWEKIMSDQKFVYLAMYGGWNTTVGVMLWHKKKWECIWNACNNFKSFAETKKRHNWSWDEGIKKARNKKYAEEIRKEAGR